MIENVQKRFLMILGDSYKSYGFSPVCGWIEGLLGLEKKELMQSDISTLLKELLGKDQIGTSISSINRAIKVLKNYGVIIERGSAKIGYRYSLNLSVNLIDIFIQSFVRNNINTLNSLKKLKKDIKEEKIDHLLDAINHEMFYLRYMEEYLEESKKILTRIRKKFF